IQHVLKTFKVDERIVWVELDGPPLSAWTSNAFKKVVGWVLDFDAIDENSQKDWASNNSDSDEDEQSIHMNDEKEEGEINENNKDEENVDMRVDENEEINKDRDREASNSPSKPPGFEGVRLSTSTFNHGKKRSRTNSTNSHYNVRENSDCVKIKHLWGNYQFEFAPSSAVGYYCIFGDFNVVRYPSERIGSLFNHRSASDFNEFINDCRFWDVPLGGHAFTRISGNGEKLSRLDRFLLSEDVEFFKGWKPLSPLQLAVEKVMSEELE
ncbi:RNA-directed DNA polymerase, eukaryota, partial [Tanacetum coccineum]